MALALDVHHPMAIQPNLSRESIYIYL
jgi:hypothetical protein